MPNRNDVQIISMQPEHQELLREIAAKEDRSMSAVVRRLLERRAVELGILPKHEMPAEYVATLSTNGHK